MLSDVIRVISGLDPITSSSQRIEASQASSKMLNTQSTANAGGRSRSRSGSSRRKGDMIRKALMTHYSITTMPPPAFIPSAQY